MHPLKSWPTYSNNTYQIGMKQNHRPMELLPILSDLLLLSAILLVVCLTISQLLLGFLSLKFLLLFGGLGMQLMHVRYLTFLILPIIESKEKMQKISRKLWELISMDMQGPIHKPSQEFCRVTSCSDG